MQNPTRIAALVCITTACTNPAAKDAAKGEVTAAKAENAPQSAPSSRPLRFNATNSSIEWVAAKVTMKHSGGFKRFSGSITLADSGAEASEVQVDIDTTSVWADNDKLTGHLKTDDFFAVEEFPQARFVSTSIAPSAAEGITHTVTGNLTLRGVTKSVAFPASIEISGVAVVAKAEFSINRKDWNVAYPGAPDNLIADAVVLRLAITAPRS